METRSILKVVLVWRKFLSKTSRSWLQRQIGWLISPACQGPSGWQHNLLTYQPLIPVLCHLQTCCHHPDH